ncbi:acyltransferase [Methylobacterium hispanicum]|uniref:acyltransferase n=1 Tax=Methylobacterium hispanicum TaxID=270350 RepID=UPI002F355F96
MLDLAAVVARNPQLQEMLGTPGYPLPRVTELHLADAALLERCGVQVSGNAEANEIWLAPGMNKYNLHLDFGLQSGNLVVIEPSPYVNGRIAFRRNDGTVILCEAEYAHLNVDFIAHGGALYVGPKCYIGGVTAWVGGPGQAMLFGEDCMTGWDVKLRTADFHGVFDLSSRTVVNEPEHTIVGPHVWLAHDVLVMKGARIGAGTTVGARSTVVRSLPPRSLAVGVPAKVVRSGVSWSKSDQPSAEDMDEIARRPYMRPEEHLAVVRHVEPNWFGRLRQWLVSPPLDRVSGEDALPQPQRRGLTIEPRSLGTGDGAHQLR